MAGWAGLGHKTSRRKLLDKVSRPPFKSITRQEVVLLLWQTEYIKSPTRLHVGLLIYLCTVIENVRTELMKSEVIPYIPNLRDWIK